VTGVGPGPQLGASVVERPIAEADDQPGLFGELHEVQRRDQATGGMQPPYECLATDDLTGFDGNDRLVIEDELSCINRSLEIGPVGEPVQHASTQIGVVEHDLSLATLFRGVQREICTPHQLGLVEPIVGPPRREPARRWPAR
jgi:hypothetical protein